MYIFIKKCFSCIKTRFWWIVAFGVSVFLCGASIRNMYIKWADQPVTVRFTEKEATISEIPFPTITICPETKANRNKLDLVSIFNSLKGQNPRKLNRTEQAKLSALSHVCTFHEPILVQCREKFTNDSIYDIIQDISPTFNDTMFGCEWNYKKINCEDLFVPVFTSDGLCFSFNTLNSEDVYNEKMAPGMMIARDNPSVTNWTLENGYKDENIHWSYPFRVFNAKQKAGLIVYMSIYKEDLEYSCIDHEIQGFKIILTPPGESPQLMVHSYRLPLMEQADLLIRPKWIRTSDGLRDYNPNTRKCFYNSERKLQFFQTYSQYNCEKECLANFSKMECGCVKFNMPRERRTKICGTASINCYTDAEKKLFLEDEIVGLKDSAARLYRTQCNCLPACTVISYDADIDRAKFDHSPMWDYYNVSLKDNPGIQLARINIYFRSHQVTTLKRLESYTYTNFLAICGGLLGLFLGVSVLSIIEFIYFLTLRLYWSVNRCKTQNHVVPINRRMISSVSIDMHYLD